MEKGPEMKVLRAWFHPNLPRHGVVQLPDGQFRLFWLTPYRKLLARDLSTAMGIRPMAVKYMSPMPEAILRQYGLALADKEEKAKMKPCKIKITVDAKRCIDIDSNCTAQNAITAMLTATALAVVQNARKGIEPETAARHAAEGLYEAICIMLSARNETEREETV